MLKPLGAKQEWLKRMVNNSRIMGHVVVTGACSLTGLLWQPSRLEVAQSKCCGDLL